MDISEEQIIYDFKQQTRGFWSSHSKYDAVNTLLLSWVEDDLGVDSEIDKLDLLFQHEFGYNTERFRIPSENSAAELGDKITAFIKQHALKEQNLTILYYGGHGDNTAVDAAGYPEWRARRSGGPTVDWFSLQTQLVNAKGDVLVLLDCCHAATKTHRSFSNGQFEILAASGSGSRVPKPGRLSFTSIVIRELRRQIIAGKDIPIRWFQNHLWNNLTQPALTESPQYFTLANYDRPTIRLAPWSGTLPPEFTPKLQLPSSFALISVAFTEDPTGNQIADWFKNYPPEIVRDVNIEGLVLKSRILNDLNETGQLFSGSVLGSLSNSAQGEIMVRVRELSRTLKMTETLAHQDPARDESLMGLKAEALKDLKSKTTAVSEVIEQSLMLDPQVDLVNAQEDRVVAACELGQSISLRQQLLSSSAIEDRFDLPRKWITWEGPSNRQPASRRSQFRIGKFRGHSVVAEICHYEDLYVTTTAEGSLQSAMQQFKRMVAQLCHPKRTSFHILPGLGYIHERSSKTLSLIFELDDALDDSVGEPLQLITLSDYMSKQRRVPLGERIKLAFALAQAVESFHKVGWVHKSLKSSNIAFFHRDNPTIPKITTTNTTINIERPWLFGFEYARPEDADSARMTDYTMENNVYKHPDRWGKPTINFNKAHDVYSLVRPSHHPLTASAMLLMLEQGIIFSEIAYWKPVKDYPEMRQKHVDPKNLRNGLLERLGKDGAHMCGKNFANTILSCLQFTELSKELSDFGSHSLFTERIVKPLQEVGNV